MIIKKKINYLVLTLLILVMACGPSVTTTKMGTKSLDSYDTFAYLPNSNFDDIEKFESDNSVGTAVIDRVNKNMKQKGYTMDRSNPDLLVLLTTKTDMEKYVNTDPVYATYPRHYNSNYTVSPYYNNYYYYGYNNYNNIVGYDRDITTYEDGTLILSLVDSDTKNVVWKANASAIIGNQKDSNAISKFVDDIFKEFPNSK